jgi:hypothetical protein
LDGKELMKSVEMQFRTVFVFNSFQRVSPQTSLGTASSPHDSVDHDFLVTLEINFVGVLFETLGTPAAERLQQVELGQVEEPPVLLHEDCLGHQQRAFEDCHRCVLLLGVGVPVEQALDDLPLFETRALSHFLASLLLHVHVCYGTSWPHGCCTYL